MLVIVAALVGACSGEKSGSGSAESAILFIGDGMGASHRSAIRLSAVGLESDLEMDSLQHSGLSRTNSADPGDQVTDSAAGGTAIASGVKTYNGAVGVDAEGERVATLLESAKREGKSVGLVTTSQVTDATPAAFAAHVTNRAQQSEIARQYIEETRPDVILGGGDYGYPEERGGSPGSILARGAERLGYDYVTDAGELDAADGPKILGLFADEEMFEARTEASGDAYDPAVPLPAMTRKAIDVLSRNEKGFFLLVEEEAIDEMSHANNAELVLEAGRQLDEAVGIAKDYAEERPDTLLVVAADHETGGMSIEDVGRAAVEDSLDPGEDGPFRVADSESRFSIDWTTEDHTAAEVPITASGPGAVAVEGVYENTHLHDAIREALLPEK